MEPSYDKCTTSWTMMAYSFSKSLVFVRLGNMRILSGSSTSFTSTYSADFYSRGLFMNKYIFPGADASCSLGWVINQLESAGFEIKNIDVLGVHYSATIYRWYQNWLSNKEKVISKYGERWYRIWVYFLAYSTITSRSVFTFTVYTAQAKG
jgi:cyclopropane fatty-acyl-phospholipid synthase-like methyltransferase